MSFGLPFLLPLFRLNEANRVYSCLFNYINDNHEKKVYKNIDNINLDFHFQQRHLQIIMVHCKNRIALTMIIINIDHDP